MADFNDVAFIPSLMGTVDEADPALPTPSSYDDSPVILEFVGAEAGAEAVVRYVGYGRGRGR